MILLELFLFLLSIVFLSVSIAGYGSFLSKKIQSNFFLDIFLGFIIISLIITFYHFFFKVNVIINLFIFIFGLIFFFKKKNFSSIFSVVKKSSILNLIIIILLIPLFISQKYHEDFGYYHLPYALAFLEEKIVFGFANIDITFVYNSIWLNIYSFFFLQDKNFNFLTFPSFLLFLSFTMFSIDKILKKKNIQISDYYLAVVLFYFLLKFTRISEFGVDLPANIFSILGIFFFIKFFEATNDFEKKSFFYFNFVFSIFAILVKLSTIPIIILPFYLYFSNIKQLKYFIFKLNFLIVYFLFIVFAIQQFIYTGCFLFPTNLTCLNVSWFDTDHINLSKKLELTNKSYSVARDIFSPEEYLENFTWFYFWIKRNFIEIIEHLLTMLIPLLIFFFVLRKKKTNFLKFSQKKILFLFCIFSLFFWLNYSPVIRFVIPVFVTFIFLICSGLFFSREFSKKLFISFSLIFLIFNFSKNFLRIIDSDEIFLGIQKIENKFLVNKINSNRFANIYYPDLKKNEKNGWQGRLCWNIPFICSYNKLDVMKKNGYLIINKLKIKND